MLLSVMSNRTQSGEVVAIQGDIQSTYRDWLFLDSLDDACKTLSDRNASAANPDQTQVPYPVVLLDHFMRKTNQGALDLGSRHDLRFLAQVCLTRVGPGSHERCIIRADEDAVQAAAAGERLK